MKQLVKDLALAGAAPITHTGALAARDRDFRQITEDIAIPFGAHLLPERERERKRERWTFSAQRYEHHHHTPRHPTPHHTTNTTNNSSLSPSVAIGTVKLESWQSRAVGRETERDEEQTEAVCSGGHGRCSAGCQEPWREMTRWSRQLLVMITLSCKFFTRERERETERARAWESGSERAREGERERERVAGGLFCPFVHGKGQSWGLGSQQRRTRSASRIARRSTTWTCRRVWLPLHLRTRRRSYIFIRQSRTWTSLSSHSKRTTWKFC